MLAKPLQSSCLDKTRDACGEKNESEHKPEKSHHPRSLREAKPKACNDQEPQAADHSTQSTAPKLDLFLGQRLDRRPSVHNRKHIAQVRTAPAAKFGLIGILRSAFWTKHIGLIFTLRFIARQCCILKGPRIAGIAGLRLKDEKPYPDVQQFLLGPPVFGTLQRELL
jgi:hypothetical protein